MIAVPTVLVLGAGASAHCGYPLGQDLIRRLCLLRNNTPRIDLPEGFTPADVDAFLTRLGRSAYDSIDTFLEEAPDYTRLGKFLIARELKQCEDLDRLFPPNESGWYQYLFNRLLLDRRMDFSKNRLGIVTFNYDRSLEVYLSEVVRTRSKIDAACAVAMLKDLPIVHVHGILGEYPNTPYEKTTNPGELLRISEQIRISHEIPDQEGGFCNPMFEKANGMLRSAERIVFLGFGFHPDNMRRFRFFTLENTVGKRIRATWHGMYGRSRDDLLTTLTPAGFTIESFPGSGEDCNAFFRHVVSLE